MNKKYLFGMFAAASLLFATSCSDELESGNAGDLATVSFKIGVEDGVQSRAISDGKSCDKLVMEVFDADGTSIEELRQEINPAFPNGGLTQTITVTLTKGQVYSFAFWAQDADSEAYDVEDLKNVRIDYSKMKSNEEKHDAFFGSLCDYTVAGNFEKTIVLTRPFAQLNFGAGDFAAAVKAGITVKQAKVTVAEVAGQLNILDGTVSGGLKDITFDLADIISYYNAEGTLNGSEPLMVDLDGDGTKEGYSWLAMNYLLVNDATTGYQKTTGNATFTFTTNRNDIVMETANIPLQRNWRTNIIGKLTAEGEFEVVIDPVYEGEYNSGDLGESFKEYGVKGGTGKLYKTLAEALGAGETDIQLSEGAYTLDVNFNQDVTITGVDKENVKVEIPKSIYGDQYKNSLTLKNLTVNVPTGLAYDEFKFAFMHRLKNVTMENCKSTGRIRLNVADALIDNCEFNVDTKSGFDGYAIYYYGGNNSNVKVSNSTFNTAGKAIVLYNEAATVMNLDVENCTFASSDNTTDKAAIQMHTEYGISGTVKIANSTATGFLNVNGGLWNELNNQTGEKTEKFVVTVDGLTYSNEAGAYVISSKDDLVNLAQAVNNGNTFESVTVKLTDDIDLQNEFWTPIGNKTNKFMGSLDGNNKTISNLKVSTNEGAQGLIGFAGGTLSVTNLTINNAEVNSGNSAAVGAVVGKADGANITFSNIKVTGVVKLHAQYGQVGAVLGNNPNGSVIASDIVVDVEEGSYVSTEGNMNQYYDYVGGVFGQIWGSTFKNITSNIDVITDYGLGAGGISGGATGTWENISCSGNVTVLYKDNSVWYSNTKEDGNSYGEVKWYQGAGKIIGYHGNVTYTNCTSTGTLTYGEDGATSNGLYFFNSAGEKVEDSRFGCSRWKNDNTVTIND